MVNQTRRVSYPPLPLTPPEASTDEHGHDHHDHGDGHDDGDDHLHRHSDDDEY